MIMMAYNVLVTCSFWEMCTS